MVELCHGLLDSNISAHFPIRAFVSLDRAASVEFNRGRPIQLLDEVIECLRGAVKLCPPGPISYDVLYSLANQLCFRFIFMETHSNSDYEGAMTLLEMILDPNQPGKCPDSSRDLASRLAVVFALARSVIFEDPQYSEVATSRLRIALSTSSVQFDERLRLQITDASAMQASERFAQYSLAGSLEEAKSYTSQAVDISYSESMGKSEELFLESNAVRDSYSMTRMAEKIQYLEGLLPNTLDTDRHKKCLHILAELHQSKFRRTNDLSDIEESIKYSRLSLDAAHSSDPWRQNFLTSLHNILDLAFEKTRNISYLDESIAVSYDILKLRSAQDAHFRVIWKLVQLLLTREKLLTVV